MGIFTKDIRSAVPLRYCIFFAVPRLCVHLALNIGKLFFIRITVALKMHKSAGVGVFYPLIHLFGSFAAEALIAKAPAHNAGVVFISVIKCL